MNVTQSNVDGMCVERMCVCLSVCCVLRVAYMRVCLQGHED